MYRQSIEDPEGFWSEQAEKYVSWFKPWNSVSDWSFAEADARGFNRVLRGAGMSPKAPGRWPSGNYAKAFAYRAMRKAGLVG